MHIKDLKFPTLKVKDRFKTNYNIVLNYTKLMKYNKIIRKLYKSLISPKNFPHILNQILIHP